MLQVRGESRKLDSDRTRIHLHRLLHFFLSFERLNINEFIIAIDQPLLQLFNYSPTELFYSICQLLNFSIFQFFNVFNYSTIEFFNYNSSIVERLKSWICRHRSVRPPSNFLQLSMSREYPIRVVVNPIRWLSVNCGFPHAPTFWNGLFIWTSIGYKARTQVTGQSS